jgi:hypothetical protein
MSLMSLMNGQSRQGSFVEASVNIAVGMCIAFISQEIILKAYGVPVSYLQNAQMTLWFTAISLVRQFTLRRLFNRITIKS